jgi:hypothetical protein
VDTLPFAGADDVKGEFVDTTILYRPTGLAELELVRQSGFRRWPPRLLGQPIFYPVTNERYAIAIARDWNAKESGVGYVTRFAVRSAFVSRYEVKQVGSSHTPSCGFLPKTLNSLNDNIIGGIEVIAEYRAAGA